MAFIIRDCDNVRESFTSTGTTITAGGAVANHRALSAVLTNGDTFFGVARKGAEFSVGIFTWSTGGSIAQTTVWYSTNGNAAVSFSSGTGEIFMDAPSRLFDELNLKEITVTSATTCDIGAVHGGKVLISGTTTITGLGSTTIDKRRFVRFNGVLTLTHNATSLILPGGANITTAAGDTACFLQDASGNWRCVFYQPATTAGARSLIGAAGLAVANDFTDATEATGAGTTAAQIIRGGLEILKKLFVTGIAKFTNTTSSTTTSDGAVVIGNGTSGGLGVGGDINWTGAALTSYSPATPTAFTGSFTSVSATMGYKKFGKLVFIKGVLAITTIGTASGFAKIDLPVTPLSATAFILGGFNGTTQLSVSAHVNYVSANQMAVSLSGAASGDSIYFSGVYWAA